MDAQGGNIKENDQNQKDLANLGLGPVIFKCMKKHQNKVLQYLADTDETDTYGQVLTRCIRTALKLREKGVTKDDIISTCTYNHKNTIVPIIASLFIDVKTANFDQNLSHIDTVHLLKTMKPKIMFVTPESLPFIERCLEESQVNTELVIFGDSKKYSNFSEFLQPNSKENEFEPAVIDNAKETALIMFSSGTTGLPKGICLSHYGLLGQFSIKNFLVDSNISRVYLLYTTFYWISAVMMLLKCIAEGSSRVVCSKFDAAATWSIIEKYKVTTIFVAPYHARDLLAAPHKDVDVSSLTEFLTGAAAVNTKLMEDLRTSFPNAKVGQGYGQTEAGGSISFFNVYDSNELEMQNRKPLSCGKILPFFKWKVVDPITEETLGPNQRGELRYKSDYQMNGYYNMDSSSAYDSDGYLKSGDIVYYDEEGCFYVVDRIKEMFKYRGWHIVPAVLEGLLMNHPAVKEAVVVGIPHEIDGDHPMGIVALNKGYEGVTPEDIECYMNELVPEIQRLRAGVKIVNNIMRTTTGKVKRTEMRRMVLSGDI